MLIHRQNMKRKIQKPSYLMYSNNAYNTTINYSSINTDDFVKIINKNNITNIEKIIIRRLATSSIPNIIRLIDFTNLLKTDFENKIKNNKGNRIFIGLSFLLICLFSIIYIYILYYVYNENIRIKAIMMFTVFLITIRLLFKINEVYPSSFIQKIKLEKLHTTTKILQKIRDSSY